MAAAEPPPRPGQLEPGQGCPGVTVSTGTDCGHLCRQCLGSTKRFNSITIFTLGCPTDHKLILSLLDASVSLSDRRILACFKGHLQTESYCLRNKASRMDLRRKNHLGCLSTEDSSGIWESWNQKGASVRNCLHLQIKVDFNLTPHTVENATFSLYWGAPRSKLLTWPETALSCTYSQCALPWSTRDKFSELSRQVIFLSIRNMIFKKIFWKCRKSS